MDKPIDELSKWLLHALQIGEKALPELLQHIVAWNIATNITGIVLSLGIFTCLYIFRNKIIAFYNTSLDREIPVIVATALISIIAGVIFTKSVLTLPQLIFAPDIFLLEYLKGLL